MTLINSSTKRSSLTCATATDVEGIFRLNGSSKRIKELQVIFDSPDRYGKGLDWTGYTVHDAANILRRYLTHLPQPLVPLDFYEQFREPLRTHQAQAIGDMEAQSQDMGDFDQHYAITTYQRLITELPPLNRQLLLYILDLLAVFASKSDMNLMTSVNLAAIFQPGLLSHPTHDMRPQEYRLSQDVLTFLIDNQDSFLIGMSGTAADEKTVREVQSGASTRQPNTPTSVRASQTGLGRSVSNASGGTDSSRKFGGVRRNVSVSSKNSKKSTNLPSPATPSSGANFANSAAGSGIHRSNTLPSKKSPGLSTSRFNRPLDSPISPSAGFSSGGLLSPAGRTASPVTRLAPSVPENQTVSPTSSFGRTPDQLLVITPVGEAAARDQSKERLLPDPNFSLQPPPQGFTDQQPSPTPTRERKISGLFSKSPSSDTERAEVRQPNKLRKKRITSGTAYSTHSSTHSLHNTPDSPGNQAFYTPMPTPGPNTQMQGDPMASAHPVFSNTMATPSSETPPQVGDGTQERHLLQSQSVAQSGTTSKARPERSPTPSLRSRASATDLSDIEHNEDPARKAEKAAKKHRWTFSSTKKSGQSSTVSPMTSSQIGSNAVAATSTSSVGSWSKSRKSMASDGLQGGPELLTPVLSSAAPTLQHSSNETGIVKEKDAPKEKESPQEGSDKKGPLTWLKAKVAQAKEERKEREAEKERAKSPPRSSVTENSGSKHSLATMAQDIIPTRGRSMDGKREEKAEKEAEPRLPTPEAPRQA